MHVPVFVSLQVRLCYLCDDVVRAESRGAGRHSSACLRHTTTGTDHDHTETRFIVCPCVVHNHAKPCFLDQKREKVWLQLLELKMQENGALLRNHRTGVLLQDSL